MTKIQLSKKHKIIATPAVEEAAIVESKKPTRSERKPLTVEQEEEGKQSRKAWRKRELLKKKFNESYNIFKELSEKELNLIYAKTEEGYENAIKAIIFGMKALKTSKWKLSDAKITVPILSKERQLFCWDNVPGDDNGSLVKFLKKKFNIKWANEAKIEKIDYGKTLKVLKGKYSISFELDDTKTIVKLEIGDNKIHEFIAKTENGKLNIYEGEKEVAPFGFYFEKGKLKREYRLLRNGKIVSFELNKGKLQLKPIFDVDYKDKDGKIIKGYKGSFFDGDLKEAERDFILIEILMILMDCIPAKDLKELIDEIENSDINDRVHDITCGIQTDLEVESVCHDEKKCPKVKKGDFCSALALERALQRLNHKYLGSTENG